MRRFVQLTLVGGLALAATGCLGEPGEELEGAWTLGSVSGRDCLMVLEFGAGEFEHALYCSLNDGSTGLELSRGRYKVVGNTATFTPTHATCGDASPAGMTTPFSIDGDILTLDLPRGRFALRRGRQDPPGAATYGCFAPDFTFAESMLKLL